MNTGNLSDEMRPDEPSTTSEDDRDHSRRKFLLMATGAVGGIALGAYAVPAIRSVIVPKAFASGSVPPTGGTVYLCTLYFEKDGEVLGSYEFESTQDWSDYTAEFDSYQIRVDCRPK